MKKVISFNQGVIGGEDMQAVLSVLPQLESSFKQRKEFWEFYFSEVEVELSIEDIEQLSDLFIIKISFEQLVIQI